MKAEDGEKDFYRQRTDIIARTSYTIHNIGSPDIAEQIIHAFSCTLQRMLSSYGNLGSPGMPWSPNERYVTPTAFTFATS